MSVAKSSNPFYSPEEEVDDEEFLNHPRAGSSGFMIGNSASPSGFVTVEERQRQLLMKKREIEQSTLDSSNRSLGLLYESEKVGNATAEELSRQKEQLLRTEGRLDEINSTLKTSERHLNGIKSVFGGIKNYLFARNNGLPPPSNPSPTPSGAMAHSISDASIRKHYQPPDYDDPRMASMREENHPALRSRGLAENKNSVDEILDRNLDEMAMGLSRLKGLALDLNSELDEHDDILNRLDDKASHAGIKVAKQNKDMSKLLGSDKKK